MTALCHTCRRPDPTGGTTCTTCAGKVRAHLHTIADITPAARAVAAGMTRSGPHIGGAGTIRLQLNLTACARLDAVTTELTTWVRHIAAERGLDQPCGPDLIVACATWLSGHVEWMRHRQEAPDHAAGIAAALKVLEQLIDGPAERRWLGQCGEQANGAECTADLHARVDAVTATCRACRAIHDVAARREWLATTARGYAYTAVEIEQAYGIAASTIRVWAHRHQIRPSGEVEGRPVYPLGEVLDLAARKAAHRATLAARRRRREETAA